MKRVLQIMGGLKRGGLESFVMNIYHRVNRNEIQFDFLLSQVTGGEHEKEAQSLGANIYRIPPRNEGYRAYMKSLDDFFQEHHNYIAIHEHISSLSSIEPAYYAKKYGIPIRIFHAHSSAIQKSLRMHWSHILLHYLNKPKVHSWATHYLGCSDKAIDWVYNYTGVRSKAVMVNNGIDCGQYAYSKTVRDEMRKEFGIQENDFVIGHVGRFIPLKNQLFLIDIIDEIIKKGISARLLLIGEGPTMNDIVIKTKAKGLEDIVIFTGVRSDVSRLLQAMDVFVMPSWFEGLPVSLIEAQAAGLPSVVSSAISHDSDVTGTVLFKSIDETALEWAKCIVDWKNKKGRPDNIEKIKNSGFDSEMVAKQLYKLYVGGVI